MRQRQAYLVNQRCWAGVFGMTTSGTVQMLFQVEDISMSLGEDLLHR
jgi:hypothetical protein